MRAKVSLSESKTKTAVGGFEEFDPFSPFKKGPGKPSLRDEYLWNQRDAAVCLLEPMWAEIGWDLERAKEPDDILAAFQRVEGSVNSELLTPFLRSSCEPATSRSSEATRKKREKAGLQLTQAEQERQTQARAFEEANRAAATVSAGCAKQLREELLRRKKNVAIFKIQITRERGKIRGAQLRQQKRLRQQGAERLNLAVPQDGLKKLEADHAEEQRICLGVEERLRLMTPQRRMIAVEEARSQGAKLKALEEAALEAAKNYQALNEKLSDEEAYFCRTQLLKFIRDGRYAHTPRKLADAIAGLPYITCQVSAARCARWKCTIALSLRYEVFVFVSSALERHRNLDGKPRLVDWFRQEIVDLPKTKIIEGKKREYFLRTYLAENWAYLKRAIEESAKLNSHPRAMPHKITSNFLENSRTSDSVDRILAEREMIRD